MALPPEITQLDLNHTNHSFRKISAQFFAKLLPSAVDNDSHQYLGNAQHSSNLGIAETFQKSQRKNFRRTRLELSQGSRQRLPQLARVVVARFSGEVREFHRSVGLPRPYHVEGRIDRCPAQVTFLILECRLFEHIPARLPSEQSHKHDLGYVLGVCGVPRDPVRRAENQAVVRPKHSIEFARNCDCPFLDQCALQRTPPVAVFHN